MITGRVRPLGSLEGPRRGSPSTGQDFGLNVPTLTFSPSSGISYTVTGHNDSTIEASITVASGTPNEDVSVSVTNNGYGGNSFAPVYGSGGEPAERTRDRVRFECANSHKLPRGYRQLRFKWEPDLGLLLDSSISGADVSDLTNCSVREYATYPDWEISIGPAPHMTPPITPQLIQRSPRAPQPPGHLAASKINNCIRDS